VRTFIDFSEVAISVTGIIEMKCLNGHRRNLLFSVLKVFISFPREKHSLAGMSGYIKSEIYPVTGYYRDQIRLGRVNKD